MNLLRYIQPRLDPALFKPVLLRQIEVGEPISDIRDAVASNGAAYERARVLVRLHSQPIGVVDLTLQHGSLGAAEIADQIWNSLRVPLAEHLAADGLPVPDSLSSAGIASPACPGCLAEREAMRERAPLISIVIPTRDRVDYLTKCLDSIAQLDYPLYEIIVVENIPRTSVVRDMLTAQYPQVRYFCEQRPGSQWVRNCGLRHALGDIVAFTDDDAMVDRYWLLELACAFAVDARVACVTGLGLPAEIETQAQEWFERFGSFNKGRDFQRSLFSRSSHVHTEPLYPYLASRFGAGVNMAFRTRRFRELGGFDPASVNGHDIEAFFRVIMNGNLLVSAPAAIVHHHHRRDYDSLQKQLYTYGASITAFISKCIHENPLLLFYLLARLPHVLRYLISPKSTRNQTKQAGYPLALTVAELSGMLYGPIAFVRRRAFTRRLIEQFGALELT